VALFLRRQTLMEETITLSLAAGFALFIVAAVVLTALFFVRRYGSRWIETTTSRVVVGSVFRAAPTAVARERAQRRVWFVMIACVITLLWAILTIVTVAPIGGLVGLFASEHAHGAEKLFWLAILIAAIDAFPLAGAMGYALYALLRRGERSVWLGLGANAWNVLHHLWVIGAGIVVLFSDGPTSELGWFTTVTAGVGLVIAGIGLLGALLALPTREPATMRGLAMATSA
jgi:hypothetical protein